MCNSKLFIRFPDRYIFVFNFPTQTTHHHAIVGFRRAGEVSNLNRATGLHWKGRYFLRNPLLVKEKASINILMYLGISRVNGGSGAWFEMVSGVMVKGLRCKDYAYHVRYPIFNTMFITFIRIISYVGVEAQWSYIIPNLYFMCMCTHIIILLDFT